jgi:hypothetical protein
MQEFELQHKWQKTWFELKEKSLNLKFKPYNIYNINQICKDFIQAFEIHSELMFKHCSCYSNTRGVTALPLIEISPRDFDGVAALVGTSNNRTFPHYDNTKSGWRE